MLACDILTEEAGYRVIKGVNAEEALTLLKAGHDIRLVFTDVDMPGTLNGFALARTVDMRFPGIKVIVTSGAHPNAGDLPTGMQFLAKPNAPSVLIVECRRCCTLQQSLSRSRWRLPWSIKAMVFSQWASRLVNHKRGSVQAGGTAFKAAEQRAEAMVHAV